MLSILIPTYNYNVFQLVSELNKQCLECNLEFEILCQDDFSTNFISENSKIDSFENCFYFKNDKNIGRTATRNILSEKAKYSWLLFLDSDVIPVGKNFISQYVSFFNSKFKVILGGYQYLDIKPEETKSLRYKYGRKCEEKSAIKRNLNPYQYVFSGNVLIQKETFLKTNYRFDDVYYGMDVYFAYQLFIDRIPIYHIDNSIYHLGLEDNEVFLKKSLDAVQSRKLFLLNAVEIEKISPIIKSYKTLKKYRLNQFVAIGFKLSESFLKFFVLSKNPSIFCFNLYRLGYLCSLK